MDDDGEADVSGSMRQRWFSRTPREIDDERRAAEEAGREAYAEAIRSGEDLEARTPDELVQLGRARLAQRGRSSTAALALQDCGRVQDARMQVDAFARAAANKATFGLADHLAAAGDAIGSGGDPDQIWRQYQSNLRDQRARDAYDAEHRAIAHRFGGDAGDVLSFALGAEAGAGWSAGLSPAAKGRLGEVMSIGKTIGRRDLPKGFFKLPKRLQIRQPVEGGATIADHATMRTDQLVEAKFGPHAKLTPRQLQAMKELGPRYRIDRWGPQHVGIGAGATTAAASIASDDDGSP